MSEPIYVDPEMATALERLASEYPPAPDNEVFNLQNVRAQTEKTLASLNQNPPPISCVENITIDGLFGPRKARIYDDVPRRKSAPGLIYFHGGGWILGDLETEDAKLRRMAKYSGVRIISYDYVLAPEHKFPDPLDDCYAAALTIRGHADTYGLDPSRIAIGGSSAGANLALATALKLRDGNQDWLKFMPLFFGSYDMVNRTPSWDLFGKGYMLDADYMGWLFGLYLSKDTKRNNPLASPLFANLAGLPPAYLNAAGLDILRDENRALAKKLKTAGVKTQYEEIRGVPHGYTLLAKEVTAANNAIKSAAQALSAALT